jgi:MoxR-like ATPase
MRKGPVTIAMEMGCILLLDECDACNPQLLIDLHPVLDGKGILMKKANTMIFSTDGFCVLATANTKGRGDMSGDFVISQIIGKPFLDRFDTAVEFMPPSKTEIEAILKYEYRHLPADLMRGIGAWFQQIQDARANGVLTEGISIRKVKSVAKMMVNYNAKLPSSNETKEAIADALNLKDPDITNALVSLWDSMLVSEFKTA